MAEGKFTQAHIKALDDAIAQKRANPGMEFLTDALNAAAAAAAAAAVAAAVGAETKPIEPAAAVGKVPQGGFSLDDLIKARENAVKHSS